MFRSRRRLIALSAALLHVAATAIGLGHRHHDHASPSHAAAVNTACCHHHTHCSHEKPGHPQSPGPVHHHDDCAACRHLAQPLWHVVVELELSASPLLSTLPQRGTPSAAQTPQIGYLSRGPPGNLA
jgi:hypothetical protein